MIIVNNHFWDIEFVNPDNAVLCRENGEYSVGVTDKPTRTVYLSNGLYGAFLRRVISHEVVHVFCFEYHMLFDPNEEEVIADFISKYGDEIIYTVDALLQTLKRYA